MTKNEGDKPSEGGELGLSQERELVVRTEPSSPSGWRNVGFDIPPMPWADKMKAETVTTPMRDGVGLALDLYFPEVDGPWPVVLERTPYGRREPYMFAPLYYLLQAGYVLAIQDCRGRFDSEGLYRPFLDDLDDGYDTVEWLAAHPWSTAKIGMIGTSAMGITSYLAAMSQAPHLAAAAVSLSRNPNQTLSRFPGGLYLESGFTAWDKIVGVGDQQVKVPRIANYSAEDIRFDLRNFYSKINTPFIHLGGWFDINLQSTLENFNCLQKDGLAPARGNQKLIMAALGHTGPVDGVKFPQENGDRFIPQQTSLNWFNHWLKGEQNDVLREPAVRYYLMGDTFDTAAPGNEWREAESWPPDAQAASLYLQAVGSLAEQPAETEALCSYIYDPLNPVPTEGGNNLFMSSGPLDQRSVSQRADVLRFIGAPLSHPVEVVGRITTDLWVSTDAEDTDFIVKLIDVHPSGYEALVRDQGLRLRHRGGPERQDRIEPGRIYPIVVDLWSTALVFNKGHRIGILIQSSNWPRFERHTNTWEPVSSYNQAVKANNNVHVGLQYPSRLVLPVVNG